MLEHLFRRKRSHASQWEIDLAFNSLQEWLDWRRDNPALISKEFVADAVTEIRAKGFIEPLTGLVVPPDQIENIDSNLREGIQFSGITSRARSVMHVIETMTNTSDTYGFRAFAAEVLTAFALRMRGMFPKFIGSEYTDQDAKRDWLRPIPVENLQSLSFASDFFDLVSTNEVLEHVPSIDQAFKEIYRVLKPGGWHIGTVPFRLMDATSEIKAVVRDGTLHHLTEPEYHGNPLSEDGSLVFELPGWDILERARTVGFSKANNRYIASAKYGCLTNSPGGVFVLCLQK